MQAFCPVKWLLRVFDANYSPKAWSTSEIHFLLLPSALHQQCCKERCLMQHGSSMTELLRRFLSWRKLLSPIFVCLLCFVFSFISCSGRFDFVFTVWTFLLELDPAVPWYTNLTVSGPKLLRQQVSQLGQHHPSAKRKQRACHGGGAEKAVQIATRANGMK